MKRHAVDNYPSTTSAADTSLRSAEPGASDTAAPAPSLQMIDETVEYLLAEGVRGERIKALAVRPFVPRTANIWNTPSRDGRRSSATFAVARRINSQFVGNTWR